MNSRIYSASARLLAIMLLVVPVSTLAKQKAVYGEFVANPNGCISEEVFVHARSSGGSTNAAVTVSIYREDVCRDEVLLMIKANKVKLKKGGFLFDDGLAHASLNGTLTVIDKSTRERYKISLSLNWLSDGNLISADKGRDMTELQSDEDELPETLKYNTAYRDAKARGTITVDGDQLNFGSTREAFLVTSDIKELEDD